MIASILKHLRWALLRLAIKTVERAGLAVVQVKKGDGAVYLVAANGQYVRFDKDKKGGEK